MAENYERFSFWKNWVSWNFYLDYFMAIICGGMGIFFIKMTVIVPDSPIFSGWASYVPSVVAAVYFLGMGIFMLVETFRADLKVLKNMHCPDCKEVIYRKKGPDRGYGFYATDLACLRCGWKRRLEPRPNDLPPAFGPGSMFLSDKVACAIEKAIKEENKD